MLLFLNCVAFQNILTRNPNKQSRITTTFASLTVCCSHDHHKECFFLTDPHTQHEIKHETVKNNRLVFMATNLQCEQNEKTNIFR